VNVYKKRIGSIVGKNKPGINIQNVALEGMKKENFSFIDKKFFFGELLKELEGMYGPHGHPQKNFSKAEKCKLEALESVINLLENIGISPSFL